MRSALTSRFLTLGLLEELAGSLSGDWTDLLPKDISLDLSSSWVHGTASGLVKSFSSSVSVTESSPSKSATKVSVDAAVVVPTAVRTVARLSGLCSGSWPTFRKPDYPMGSSGWQAFIWHF